MATFDYIVAIYNPNSTHGAKQKAVKFRDAAKQAGIAVEIIGTTHQGHATEIARDTVSRYRKPLLISVSGDGGYNELVNGVIAAKKDTKKHPSSQ